MTDGGVYQVKFMEGVDGLVYYLVDMNDTTRHSQLFESHKEAITAMKAGKLEWSREHGM